MLSTIHVLLNVGSAVDWVTSNGIVIEEPNSRETGESPVVQETPGEYSSCISKDYESP